MKGVVLAGGAGTRLRPMTLAVNKHLLPVYDRAMVQFPLEMLAQIGVSSVAVVTSPEHVDAMHGFLGAVGAGPEVGVIAQEGGPGIASALASAASFAGDGPICVALGDNIIGGHVRAAARSFEADPVGALAVVKEVSDPRSFGVASYRDAVEGDPERVVTAGRVIERIEEKPEVPPSRDAVIGVYFYDRSVFERIEGLTPSARGELEVTDLNNAYASSGDLGHDRLEGWWADAGSPDSLLVAANLVAQRGANRVTRG